MLGEEGTIAAVAILPSPWPPVARQQLLVQERGGARITLSVESSGHILVSITRGSDERNRAFGPLDIPGAARVVVMLTWSPTHIGLSINGVEVEDLVVTAAHLGITAANVGVPIPSPFTPGLGLRSGWSEAEQLFISTLIDLDQKATAGTKYSLIRAAGLLRQLLMDGTPLVHVVNRKYRVPVEFETIDFSGAPPGDPEVHWLVLDPEPFPNARIQTCTLQQFVAAPCLSWNGHRASVGDLVSACANAKGGIHLGRAKVSAEQLLLDWDEVVTMLGDDPSLRAIKAVTRVALRGLTRLARAISEGAA